MLANGTEPEYMSVLDLDEWRAAYREGYAREMGDHYGSIEAGDEDGGFSRAPCELCRRPLAGDRWRAVVLYV
jgi:hypothetical protein